jgi:predicted esterase
VIIHTIEARTHGRYIVESPAADTAGEAPLLVGFHGHAESAEMMLENLRAIGAGWHLVSVQALHRFYTKRGAIVATWMTRQDRELAIADNTAYVWSVVDAVRRGGQRHRPLVFVGFSQGVAMAYRAAAAGDCNGLIVLAGDVPPDVALRAGVLPPILLGRGRADDWYTEEKGAADHKVLSAAGVDVTEHVFDGGHVWHPFFVAAATRFLAELKAAYGRE